MLLLVYLSLHRLDSNMYTFHYSSEYKYINNNVGRRQSNTLKVSLPNVIDMFLGVSWRAGIHYETLQPLSFRPGVSPSIVGAIEARRQEDIRHPQKNKHHSLTSARNMESSAKRSDAGRLNMATSATMLIKWCQRNFYEICMCRSGNSVACKAGQRCVNKADT